MFSDTWLNYDEYSSYEIDSWYNTQYGWCFSWLKVVF